MDLGTPTTVLKHVKWQDLPKLWQKKVKVAHIQTFKITIEPEDKTFSNKEKLSRKKALQDLEKIFKKSDENLKNTEFENMSEEKIMDVVNSEIADYRAEKRNTAIAK